MSIYQSPTGGPTLDASEARTPFSSKAPLASGWVTT